MAKMKNKTNTTKIIKNSDLAKLLPNKNLRSEVKDLFLKDYLSTDLIQMMYPGIDWCTAEDKSYKPSTKKTIKNKLYKIFDKMNDDLIKNIEIYLEAKKDLRDENSSFYKELWFEFWKIGRGKLFENMLYVDSFLKEYDVIDRIIFDAKIEDLVDIYENKFSIKMQEDFKEFIAISTRASVCENVVKITFETENRKFDIDCKKINIFSI